MHEAIKMRVYGKTAPRWWFLSVSERKMKCQNHLISTWIGNKTSKETEESQQRMGPLGIGWKFQDWLKGRCIWKLLESLERIWFKWLNSRSSLVKEIIINCIQFASYNTNVLDQDSLHASALRTYYIYLVYIYIF